MKVTEIRVEFRKTVSDGNYGNETFSASLTGVCAQDDDAVAEAHLLCEDARHVVLGQLRQSQSPRIQRALETPEEREARVRREEEEYAEQRRQQIAQKVRWVAESTTRSAQASDDSDDSDDDAEVHEVDLHDLAAAR